MTISTRQALTDLKAGSFIPDAQLCIAGGTGFLMVVDQVTGGRNSQSPFDVNPVDGKFTTDDYVTFSDGSKAPESGIAIVGPTPGFAVANDNNHALIQQFNGKIAEKDLNLDR
jgi:Tfp pilus tip-associated adhesin PilY1